MKPVHAGRLRGIGYDKSGRLLMLQLDDGSVLQYSNVTEDIWRRFSSSGSAWSYYRDKIEEEYAVKKVTANAVSTSNQPAEKNPLDDLFGK